MSKIKTNLEVIKALKAWDIDHVYGMPGDSIDAVVDGLKTAEDEIEFYNVRHEEVASLTASAYTKLTGTIGVGLAIGGPGAIHLLNGMYDAKLDNIPQLMLVGQVDSEAIGSKVFQEVNLPALFEDVAVYNKQLDHGDDVFNTVNDAIRTAYDKKGVAVLVLPNDLLMGKSEKHEDYSVDTKRSVKPEIPGSSIHAAANLLAHSEKPVMLMGIGTSGASLELKDFIEKAKIPVIISLPAKGILPDVHPYNLGNLGQIGTKPAYNAIKNADLLILAGTNFPYTDYLPDKDIPSIQIDIDKEVISHRFNVDVPVIGDAADAFKRLTTSIDPVDQREFLNDARLQRETWDKWMEEDMSEDDSPIKPERVMGAINGNIDGDTVFSIDVGTATVWSTRYLNLGVNNKFVISSWLGTMGCGLPGAIAGKIAYPERQVIGIVGDGAFQMVMHDFATAVQYDLPVIIFVLNNRALSFIKYEQQAAGELEYATEFSDIDFAKYAEISGGVGYTLEAPEDIDDIVSAACKESRPTIVNVYVDPNAAPLPGQITSEEAKNYVRWAYRSLKEDKSLNIDEIPSMKTAIRRFF